MISESVAPGPVPHFRLLGAWDESTWAGGGWAASLTTWPGLGFVRVLLHWRKGDFSPCPCPRGLEGPPRTLSFYCFRLFYGFGTRQTAEKGQRDREDSLSFKNDHELSSPLLPAQRKLEQGSPPELPLPQKPGNFRPISAPGRPEPVSWASNDSPRLLIGRWPARQSACPTASRKSQNL